MLIKKINNKFISNKIKTTEMERNKIIGLSILLTLAAFSFITCENENDETLNDSDSDINTDSIRINNVAPPVFNPDIVYGTLTDQEGNVYKTVVIGSQTWMAENLRSTIFNDGSPIPNVSNREEWIALDSGAYCNQPYANEGFIKVYGRLYNWYAVKTGELAPLGWHVPSDEEWTTLINYVGGANIAGGILKETDTTHWKSPNTGATNGVGFTALPIGVRDMIGDFRTPGKGTIFWSSTPTDSSEHIAWPRSIYYDETYMYRFAADPHSGMPIRCIKN